MRKIGSVLIKNIATNGLGLFVTIFNQIALIPIYLKHWSVDLYSDWIVLSAISLFFATSDLGFTTVSTNKFTISFARGMRRESGQILTNNYAFLIVIFLLFIPIIWCLGLAFSFVDLLGLHTLSYSEANLILFFLVFHIFISMLGKVPNAIYRATSRAHKAFFIDNITWLAESLTIILCLIFKCSIITLSALYTLPRLCFFIYKLYSTHSLFNHKINISDVSFREVKSLIVQSFSIASLPLANSIIMQGLSLVVNRQFGASDLILFNTTRTMVNMVKFSSNIVTNSFYPEFAIAYGKNDLEKILRLNHLCKKTALVLNALSALLLVILGDYIYSIWIGGKLYFSLILMISFLLPYSIENYWNASLSPLISINKHKHLGFYALGLSVFYILLIFITIKFINIPSIVLLLNIIHIPMLLLVTYNTKTFFKNFNHEQLKK